MIKNYFKIAFILFFFFFSFFLYSEEKTKTYVDIILDASGSMWEKVGSEHKIKFAKDTFQKIIPKIDPSHEVGLVVYGHRRPKDCSDIETLVPIGLENRSLLSEKIQGVQPEVRSMTPISDALKEAANNLKDKKGDRSILLISDGKESCGKDPCKVAEEIIKSGIDVKINVVGFDIKDKEADKQLACIAKVTGGTYLLAKEASDLFKKIETTIIRLPWNLKILPIMKKYFRVKVINEKTNEMAAEFWSSSEQHVPAGTYSVEVSTPLPFTKKGVVIEEGKQTIIQIPGFGQLTTHTQKAASNEEIYITIKNKDQTIIKDNYNLYDAEFILPADTYTVEFYRQRNKPPLWVEKDVKITENQITDVYLKKTGKLNVDLINSQSFYVTVIDEKGNKTYDNEFHLYSETFVLMEGKYTVEVRRHRDKKPLWVETATVTADKTTNISIKGVGGLGVAFIQNQSFYVSVKNVDSGEVFYKEEFHIGSELFVVPVGKYSVTVTAHAPRGKLLWQNDNIVVQELKTSQNQVNQVGVLNLYTKRSGMDGFYFTIWDEKGNVVIDNNFMISSATFSLPVGKYTMDAYERGTKKSILINGKASFEIKEFIDLRFEIKFQEKQ